MESELIISPAEVAKSLAEEYPEFVGVDEKTGKRYFNIAAFMRSKGYIK